MDASQSVQLFDSLPLLAQFTQNQASGCLQMSNETTSWSFYLERGKLNYASDSAHPFKRLDRHLRYLSHQVPNLVSAIRIKLRLQFAVPIGEAAYPSQDYQAICWLVDQHYLSSTQAAILIEALAKEVIGTFQTARIGNYTFIEQDQLEDVPKFCQLDLSSLIRFHPTPPISNSTVSRTGQKSTPSCSDLDSRREARPLHLVQTLLPSTHLSLTSDPSCPDAFQSFGSFDPSNNWPAFCQVKQSSFGVESESIQFARKPEIPGSAQPCSSDSSGMNHRTVSFTSKLNHSGFDQRLLSPVALNLESTCPTPGISQMANRASLVSGNSLASGKTYTIVCIDDSPAVLQTFKSFLNNQSFKVIVISDPVKALMEIVRSRTDLILLDITMPRLNGYELCSLLRKHPDFKKTPIIMVTSNLGLIDRAKAKLVGASGYLTKPFTQSDLVKVIFKHLVQHPGSIAKPLR